MIDPLCKSALQVFIEKNNGSASVSALQRHLGIGYIRAGRILETLKELQCLTNMSEDNSALTVTVKLEMLDDLFPDLDN